MAKKLNSKKKIIIAVSLLAVLLVGAIVSVVLVLAANQQGVNSNITVSYSVQGVAAKANANYAIVATSGSVSQTAAMTTSSGSEEIVFNVSNAQTTESISPQGNIELDVSNQTVVFEYVFENLAETAFSLELTESPTGVNMTETYYVSGKALDASKYASSITNESLAPQAVTYLNQKVYVYIMASVTNENLSASYNGGFAWSLEAQNTIDVTLNTSGTTSTLKVISNTIEGLENIAMPVLSSTPINGSKVFLGYYSAETDGTQYIDENGLSSHAADLTAGATLYAQFSEETVVMSGTSVTGMTETARTLGEVVIPETTTEIADSAFENETSLTNVTFLGAGETETYADSGVLISIGANAFKGCTGLTELKIPEGVTSIGEGALQNLSNLKTLVLPTTYNVQGNQLLQGCQNLRKLECTAEVIGEHTYLYFEDYAAIDSLYGKYSSDGTWEGEFSPITEVIINAGTELGQYAFYNSKVEKLTLCDSITRIHYKALDATRIRNIFIPKNVTYVSWFSLGNDLESITFEDPNGWCLNGSPIDVSDPINNKLLLNLGVDVILTKE